MDHLDKTLADGTDRIRRKWITKQPEPAAAGSADKGMPEKPMTELECLECAAKHVGIARVFLEEAKLRTGDDARMRVTKAYDHLSHASDIHLPDQHKQLAEKVRDFRKKLESCALESTPPCPPESSIKGAEALQNEIIAAIKTCPTCAPLVVKPIESAAK
jgi:hypothetical protein